MRTLNNFTPYIIIIETLICYDGFKTYIRILYKSGLYRFHTISPAGCYGIVWQPPLAPNVCQNEI